MIMIKLAVDLGDGEVRELEAASAGMAVGMLKGYMGDYWEDIELFRSAPDGVYAELPSQSFGHKYDEAVERLKKVFARLWRVTVSVEICDDYGASMDVGYYGTIFPYYEVTMDEVRAVRATMVRPTLFGDELKPLEKGEDDIEKGQEAWARVAMEKKLK